MVDEMNPLVNGFIKFCIFMLIGVIMLSSIDATSTVSHNDAIALSFASNPSDGDLVVLDGHVFEFDSDSEVIQGHIPVEIGSNIVYSKQNLITAISQYYAVSDQSQVI